MKIKHVRLPYGVPLADGRIAPASEAYEDATLTLLEPVDGIEAVVVRIATTKDVLDGHAHATNDYNPGTNAYNDALLRFHIERRATPALTPKQVDRLSGPDHDALHSLVMQGQLGDKLPHRVRQGVEVERNAYIRLHFMDDRKRAESRMPVSRAEAPALYEAYLSHSLTRFGDVSEATFDDQQVKWEDYLNIPFFDHYAIALSIQSRDYKELTEILDGRSEVDGVTLPFPGGAGDGVEENQEEGEPRPPLPI